MNDVLEKQTPYGECPICGNLLSTDKEKSDGTCEDCFDEYEETKDL